MLAHKADVRHRLLGAARSLVAADGFASASVAAVAQQADVATGTVYRYFGSKAELFAEVFREASAHEVQVMADAHAQPGTPPQRMTEGIRVWASRAIAGRTLAYALIAEPATPLVEAERLRYRRAYVDVLCRLLREGVADGSFVVDDVELAAAAIVGAMAEALVGPLAPSDADLDKAAPHIIASITNFCLRAVGAQP